MKISKLYNLEFRWKEEPENEDCRIQLEERAKIEAFEKIKFGYTYGKLNDVFFNEKKGTHTKYTGFWEWNEMKKL